MVRQLIPTVLRIDRDELRPPVPLPRIRPVPPELNTLFGLFSEDNFTAARAADRVAAVGPWMEPLILDLDNEHQFEGPAPWGIDDDRPSDSLWKLYCESLSRRYPNRSPLIISTPISLENLPTTFLTPEIRRRLPECSNLLFILRNLHEYWFGDLNFHTTTLHILTPWPDGAAGVPDILSAHGGLEQCLRVATRDPACSIALTQGYNISTTPHRIESSWRYVLRAMTLWHEASNPSDFWPVPETPINSAGWDTPEFMYRLKEILYQQQNEHPGAPVRGPRGQDAVVMPQGVLQALSFLTRHINAIEFAQREIDNGAEAILFSGIPNTLNDECRQAGSRPCQVEVTALRRSQKQIFLGQTIPAVKMVDIVLAGPAERFQRQLEARPYGASAEKIAANRVATELQWNRGVNKLMVVLDENGQGFIKGLELPQYPVYMSTLVNSTNILHTRPSSAMLPNFAYLEIDNQPPIFWLQRRRPVLRQEDRIVSTSKHNFYGPTPWMIQEPLCTQAIPPEDPHSPSIASISRLFSGHNTTPEMVASRAAQFGQWTLENYTMDPFDREERFQRTQEQTLQDPRGLDPTGWLTSDIMDAVTTHYSHFHPEVEIFSVSLSVLLTVTGDPSHLVQSRLDSRFWIFILTDVQMDQHGGHWWVAIIDRVKGHFFVHNSLINEGDPTILFNVLKPIFESPIVQNIAGSAPTLTLPWNTVVGMPQQSNGYDCGVYSVRTITSFLEELARIPGPVPTDGESQAARSYIEDGWSADEYRETLRVTFPTQPLQRAGASATHNLIASITGVLSHANHYNHLQRAFWHLDNAGGILLQMNCLTIDNMPHSCLCRNRDNGCGFSVVPVPPGHKVVLMSDSTLLGGTWTSAQNLPVMQQHSMAYRRALGRLNQNHRLSYPQREELRDKYLILASDTAQVLVGSRLEPIGNRPQGFARASFLPDDNIDKIIQILETNSKTYGGDTIRLPSVSYIRLNDQLWIWIVRPLTQSAAERWRTAPARQGAALGLPRGRFPTPLIPTPLISNVRGEELEVPTKERMDEEDHSGTTPRKRKRLRRHTASEDEGGLIGRGKLTSPPKRASRRNPRRGTSPSPKVAQSTTDPEQPIGHLTSPSRDTRVVQTPEEIRRAYLSRGDSTPTINIIGILGRTFLLPTEHNSSYTALRSYLESQRELFQSSTLTYWTTGVAPTSLTSQLDYSIFHSQMYSQQFNQRLWHIAIQQPMTWTAYIQFTTGNVSRQRVELPTRDWIAFMLSPDPLPADQTFSANVNPGGPKTILQTRGDLVRIFYSAAENLSPSIDVFVRRSVEVDSTDRAATNTARVTATRYDGDGNITATGSITMASAMDHMSWEFLTDLVTLWLGTSDVLRLGTSNVLTYVLPQSATQDPVAVDMGSFQSMIDEYNKLPDGERHLSLVVRDPPTMKGVAKAIAEETAQKVETELAITEEVKVRYWASVARDAEAGARRAEQGAAQASIQAGRQVKYAEAAESRTKASEAQAKLSVATAKTLQAEAKLSEAKARNWAAEAKVSAQRARDAVYQVKTGVAKMIKTAMENDAPPGPATPAFQDEGLELSKMFEEGGDIGQLVPGTGESAPTVPTMAPVFPPTLFEPAGGHAAEEEVVVGMEEEEDEDEDEEVEEAEEEADENEDEDEGEDEAASPTPAELLAAGNHVGNDGRRNHQREGRYYCPVCGASIRTLGEARTLRHFEKCDIHYYQLVSERPTAKKKGGHGP